MTTTMTVIAVVALVFFVAISVAVFMIWKQETQMRTDSLKGIEASLNEAIDEISQRRTYHPYHQHNFDDMHQEHFDRRSNRNFLKKKSMRQNEIYYAPDDYDREGWEEREPEIDVTVFRPSEISVKRSEAKNGTPKVAEPAKPEVNEEPKKIVPEMQEIFEIVPEENGDMDKSKEKVDLSFIDTDDLFDLDEILFESIEHDRQTDYNTGRSGKKYTAEELETLIKE